MQIQGKAFVVTGGASGLGRAVVETVVAAGGRAVILDVNAGAGKAAEEALGESVRFAEADVTSEEQVKAAVDLAVSAFGALNGVINAAGSLPPAAKCAVSGQKAMRLLVKTRSISSAFSAIVPRCG